MGGKRQIAGGHLLRVVFSWLCAVVMLADVAQAVHLRGQILRVGYPGSGSDRMVGSGDIYRVGRYTPIYIELTNDDGDQFEGVVQVMQTDADGDEVVARANVSIAGTRKLTLYVPGGPMGDENYVRGMGYEGPAPFTVHVFDAENRLAKLHDDKGEPIKELTPPRQVIAAPPDDVVILDVSQRPLNQIDALKKSERVQDFVCVKCVAKELPDHVSGLEMVDIMAWDGPDPNLLDGVVNEAIIEWVRRGGTLILGTSRNWNQLSGSALGPLLPARIDKTTSVDLRDRPELLSSMRNSRNDNKEPDLGPKSLTYCPVTRQALVADAISLRPAAPKADEQIWVARRSFGRGQVVLAMAELQDLLALDGENGGLLRDDLLRLTGTSSDNKSPTSRDLFTSVAAQTAFLTTSGFYFTFAFAFVIAYIVGVTAVSWGWLKRRNAVRQSWVVFAGAAAAASALSLGAVQLVRAVGQGVHEMTIVDGRADAYEATATSYLGLKTATHTLLDLCVPYKWDEPAGAPESRGSLRPQPGESRWSRQSTFAVPMRYQAVGPLGELRDVPLRATLKQFQATWRGELTGRMACSLRYRAGAELGLDSSSWIDNQLGTDLRHCYLLVRAKDSSGIVVYFLPELPTGQKVTLAAIGQFMAEREKKRRESDRLGAIREQLSGGDKEEYRWKPPLLRDLLIGCLGNVSVNVQRKDEERAVEQDLLARPVAPYVCPLMLLTLYGHKEMVGLRREKDFEATRSQGQELEMSSALQSGTALFIGFSEDPGPLRLCRRNPDSGPNAWKAIAPSQSVVMYRIQMPVQ